MVNQPSMRALTREIGTCKHRACCAVSPAGRRASISPSNPYMLTEKSAAVAAPTAMDKPAVLVVDDEYGPRESIAFSLSGEFTVDTAERAKDALAKLQNRQYAAVVM